MAVEFLSWMVLRAEFVDLLEGLSPPVESSTIPFVQFADDSLFLLNGDLESVQNLRGILLLLEGISGLKVNLSKSSESSGSYY